jgi:glycosyltransferase involved in cell wall biosynthesis
MKQPSVSVVIPTFNASHLITQAIDSVLAQTLVPAQIIVVDDGSRDDTLKRLAAYGDRIHCVSQKNQGVSAARNHGLRLAEGELIAFLDSDDVWHPRKIELQTGILIENRDLGLLGTGTFNWPRPILPDVSRPLSNSVVRVPWRHLVIKNYFTTSSVVVRRTVLDKVGPFDAELHGPEDHDMWLRVAEVTTVANLKLPLTGYRSVQGSLSQQAAAMEAGMQRILRKLDERQVWNGRSLFRRKAHSYLHYSCAYMYGAEGRQTAALGKLLRSFAWYPFPYHRREVRMALARPKRLLMILLRLLRIVPADPQSQTA